MSTACILIPVKRFALAKTRLAPALAPEARRALALHMLERVLAAATDIAPGSVAWSVAVITDEPSARKLARERGAAVLPEPASRGLEAALCAGAETLRALGFGRLAFVPADVPLVQPADLAALIGAHGATVRAVAGTRDSAVNALSWPARIAVPCEFGPGSIARLAACVAAQDLHFEQLELPRLAHDVDVPADLEALGAA